VFQGKKKGSEAKETSTHEFERRAMDRLGGKHRFRHQEGRISCGMATARAAGKKGRSRPAVNQRDYRSILVRPETPLREAIRVMDTGAMGFLLVTDPEGLLLGTVTDGDVRRGLLRGSKT
jgi:CBS-domain-containing membrane protein